MKALEITAGAQAGRPLKGQRPAAITALVASLSLLASSEQASFGQAGFRSAQKPVLPSQVTNLAQLRTLEREAAAARLPVRLEATVTYSENQWPSLFVQEGQSAAYVHRPSFDESYTAGERVLIEGHSEEGYTPVIRATSITRLGHAPLPEPVQTTLEEIATGRYDARRARVVTTVRWMHLTYGRLYLHVGEGSGRYEVHIPEHKGALPAHLMDARVELTGITGTKLDSHGKVIGAGMSIPAVNDIRVIVPAPQNPWDRPVQTVRTLMYFHPSTSFGQMTMVEGVVTLCTPSGRIYVQDDTGGVEVRLPAYQRTPDENGKYLPPAKPPGLAAGDRVQVIGYQGIGRYAAVLNDSRVRRMGTSSLPSPVDISGTNQLGLAMDSLRIQTRGKLVANETKKVGGGVEQRMTIEGQDWVFFALYEGQEALRASMGSQVELAGVYSAERDELGGFTGHRLLLSSPSDLRLVAGPPLVTTAQFVKVAGPLVLLALGWVGLLRRQVRKRTSELRNANDDLRREIGQRALVERSLRESEARFYRAFQANPALMALTRVGDGTFVAANKAFYETTGYSEVEVVGKSAADLRIYAVPQERDDYVRLIREHGSVRDREQRFRIKDGTIRTVLLSGELIHLDGEPHLLSVGLDISGRKQAETETLKALTRERELSVLKSNFVSLVSHEFRTPLGVIQSACDVLDRYLDRLPAEKRRKHLDMIFRSTKSLAQLVDGVLLLGKVEDGRMTFTPAPLDLASLCSQIMDEVHSATGTQNVVQLECDSELPPAWSDANLLRHILTNLLINAVKYSPAGAPVRFAVSRNEGTGMFLIQDRGIGIPAEHQPNLFKSFSRAPNVGSRPGTGLGLVIVRRCVDLHGGTIELDSIEARGTTVQVRLPLFPPEPVTDGHSTVLANNAAAKAFL